MKFTNAGTLTKNCDSSAFSLTEGTPQLISCLQNISKHLPIIYNQSEHFLEREKDLIGIVTTDIDLFVKACSPTEAKLWPDYCKHIALVLQGICHRLPDKTSLDSPLNKLNDLIDSLKPFIPKTPEREITQEMIETETRLWQKQLELEQRSDFKTKILPIFKVTAATKRIPTKKIFISYAWPVEDNHKEAWTKSFVRYLALHLEAAGLIVYLDQNQSGFGTDMQRFMAGNINDADHVLVICDRTLQYKFEEDGLTGVCFEYLQVVRRWREQRKPNFVVPICLNKESFIPGLIAKAAEVSFYQDGYLRGLKQIIQRSYGFDRYEFEKLWPEELSENINTSAASTQSMASSNSDEFYLAADRSPMEHSAVINQIEINNEFVGRVEDMNRVSQKFCLLDKGQQKRRIVALSGLPGIGKTRFVKQYIVEHLSYYRLIWWFDCKKPLDDAFVELAKSLNLNFPAISKIAIDGISPPQIRKDVIATLNKLSDWLLVFDDIDSEKSLEPYLPDTFTKGRGHILVTTNNDNWVQGTEKFEIMQPADAIDLFKSIVSPSNSMETTEEMREIVSGLLGNLPLAVCQAASYIRSEFVTTADYITKFNKMRRSLWEDETGPKDHKNTVVTSLKLIIDSLIDNNTTYAAVELLTLCANLAPNNIPRRILEIIFDEHQLINGITILKKFDLVSVSSCNKFVSMHPLVQRIVVEYYGKTIKRERIISGIRSSAFDNNSKLIQRKDLVNLCSHADSSIQNFTDAECSDPSVIKFIEFVGHLHKALGSREHILLAVSYYQKCELQNQRSPVNLNKKGLISLYGAWAEALQGLAMLSTDDRTTINSLLSKALRLAEELEDKLEIANVRTNIAGENLLGLQQKVIGITSIVLLPSIVKEIYKGSMDSLAQIEQALVQYSMVLNEKPHYRFNYVLNAYILSLSYLLIGILWTCFCSLSLILVSLIAFSLTTLIGSRAAIALIVGATTASLYYIYSANSYHLNKADDYFSKALAHDTITLKEQYNYEVMRRAWEGQGHSQFNKFFEGCIVKYLDRCSKKVKDSSHHYQRAVGFFTLAKIYDFIPSQYAKAENVMQNALAELKSAQKSVAIASDIDFVNAEISMLNANKLQK